MMKQSGNWLLILLMLIVAFFAYRKFSQKNAVVNEAPQEVQSLGENPSGSRGAPGGKPRGGPSATDNERPQESKKEMDHRGSDRGAARPPVNKEKIDPEKKRKLIQGQPVF